MKQDRNIEILLRSENGEKRSQLALEFGISIARVQQIIQKELRHRKQSAMWYSKLSTRLANIARDLGCNSMEELLAYDDGFLFRQPNFGRVCLYEMYCIRNNIEFDLSKAPRAGSPKLGWKKFKSPMTQFVFEMYPGMQIYFAALDKCNPRWWHIFVDTNQKEIWRCRNLFPRETAFKKFAEHLGYKE